MAFAPIRPYMGNLKIIAGWRCRDGSVQGIYLDMARRRPVPASDERTGKVVDNQPKPIDRGNLSDYVNPLPIRKTRPYR